MTAKIFSFLYCLFFIFSTSFCFAEASPEHYGSLVVSYQTDESGFRLDRIRFWLINENQERNLYPKHDESIISQLCTGPARKVVIDHLLPGRYTIQFVIPNGDGFFEIPQPREVVIQEGQVTKIDQEIQPHHESEPQEIAMEIINTPNIRPSLLPIRPYPVRVYNNYFLPPPSPSYFSLNTNRQVEWKLISNNRVFYSAMGSASNIPLIPNRTYTLVAEQIPGYTLKVVPAATFVAQEDNPVKIELFYVREMGTVRLDIPFTGEALGVTLTPLEDSRTPIQVTLKPVNGFIHWRGGPYFTGAYLLTYQLPPSYDPFPPQQIRLEKGEQSLIPPLIQQKGTLEVTTNSQEAIFSLTQLNGIQIGQGEGTSYTFYNLNPGTYILTFSSKGNKSLVVPSPQKVALSQGKSAQVEVLYGRVGRLSIGSNLDIFTIIITPIGSTVEAPIQRTITSRSQTIDLPEGSYRIQYAPIEGYAPPSKVQEVSITPFSTQTVYETYIPLSRGVESRSVERKENQEGLAVTMNVANSGFTLEALSSANSSPIHYKGRSLFIPLSQGRYRLTFDSLPNYQTPEPLEVEIREGNRKVLVEAIYKPLDALVEVPAGPAIIGDPFTDSKDNERPARQVDVALFSIGVYEVTNAQYASWLTQAAKEGKIILHEGKPGLIFDNQEHILCRTFEANPLAQIRLDRTPSGKLIFSPILGKENHPVIEVSWFGANLYCQDQGYRLPTEVEWEKAAGMALPQPDGILQRFKYGFGNNTIDRAWANYKTTAAWSTKQLAVLTTPVGFYNGVNTLPLTLEDRSQLTTQNAKSPVGAYDMSGNIWEWVSSWDELDATEKNKIVKGGCYDSTADGVRVSERLALDPNHSDIYTGFRVAKNPTP